MCHGSVRGALLTLLALLHSPAEELVVVWEQEATARCAARGRIDSGNLGTALKPSCLCVRARPSKPSKQHPPRAAAVSDSSDI